MSQTKPGLRFDHREIAVIFALFIFVSLLMFTVGILVGKGLSIAKYDGKVPVDVSHFESGVHNATPQVSGTAGAGTSVSTDQMYEPQSRLERTPAEVVPQAFKPIPKHGTADPIGGSLLEPDLNDNEIESILKNPEIKALLEDVPGRTPAAKTKVPSSAAKGKYTVQIASYPKKTDAETRMNNLRSMGFKHAYISAKQLSNNVTWYRVWLGYFPNKTAAASNGEFLKKSGEVKKYIVRKASKAG